MASEGSSPGSAIDKTVPDNRRARRFHKCLQPLLNLDGLLCWVLFKQPHCASVLGFGIPKKDATGRPANKAKVHVYHINGSLRNILTTLSE